MASAGETTTPSRRPRDGLADALRWLSRLWNATVPLVPGGVLLAYVLVSAVLLATKGASAAEWRDWLVIPAAMAAGGLFWHSFTRPVGDEIATPRAMPTLAVCNLVAMGFLLVRPPHGNPGGAVVALIFAGAAAITLSACVQAIRDSHGIGMESSWGGFGGGLGGWHLSKSASLALLTLALAGAAVASVHFGGT